MADKYEHLQLIKENITAKRKKRVFPMTTEKKDYSGHGSILASKMKSTMKTTAENNLVDPSLIFKIIYKQPLNELSLSRLNIDVLSNINAQELNDYVVFSNDKEMKIFFDKLEQYKKGIVDGNKSAHYENIFSNIDSIIPISIEDKIGKRMNKCKLDINKKYWINIELWHTNDLDDMRSKIESYKKIINELGDRVTDDCLSKSFCILRAQSTGKNILTLLNETNIAEIDLIPESILSTYNLLKVDTEDLSINNNINANSPSICIIDSGIMPKHPLLEDSIQEIKTFRNSFIDGIDEEGHGTLVASIALYGDIKTCIENKEFNQNFKLLISRVLNENNCFPEEVLPENLITDSIKYFNKKFNCKIFNLSLGFEDDYYVGAKQFTLAQRIDELCRENDIFVCISTGNYRNIDEEDIKKYPFYLLEEKAKIINPATAALALTVGGLCTEGEVSTPRPERGANQIVFTQYNEPSPFTRTGPGINNSMKPEVCQLAGTIYFDTLTNSFNYINMGLGVIGCNSSFVEEQKLFVSKVGTSFAAPAVANLAASILDKYKGISANTLRALIANSCENVVETSNLFDNLSNDLKTFIEDTLKTKYLEQHPDLKSIKNFRALLMQITKIEGIPIEFKNIIKLFLNRNYNKFYFSGYGIPSKERALRCSENRATMYIQDTIKLDEFNIYEVYVPDELLEIPGKKKISISLAFSPPTRHTRKDYLGYDMSYKLIRGLSIEQITDIFRARNRDEEPISLDSANDIKLFPGQEFLSNSTLKKSWMEFKQSSFISNYGNTLYLVVFNIKKWADETIFDNENFSLAITLEHTSHEIDLDLYSIMKSYIKTRTESKTKLRNIEDKLRGKTKY